MSGAPLVSVVIPTHNRSDVVGRAIASARAQTTTDIEIIVVDDASSDETKSVVAGIRDDRVRYVRRDERGGGSAARNTGIREAIGSYVAFLDSDDEWLATKLEQQLRCIRDGRGPVLAMCAFVRVQGASRRRAWPAAMGARDAAHRLLSLVGGPMSASLFMVSRAQLLDSGVEFDPDLPALQDLDFAFRLSAAGFAVDGPRRVLVRKHRDRRREHVFNLTNEIAARRRLLVKYDDHLSVDTDARRRHRRLLARALLRSGEQAEAAELLRANASHPESAWDDRVLSVAARQPQCARAVDWAFRMVEGVRGGRFGVRVSDVAHDAVRLARRAGRRVASADPV